MPCSTKYSGKKKHSGRGWRVAAEWGPDTSATQSKIAATDVRCCEGAKQQGTCFKTNDRIVRVSEAEGYLSGLIYSKECCKNHTTQQIPHKRFIGGEGIPQLSERGWKRKERQKDRRRE